MPSCYTFHHHQATCHWLIAHPAIPRSISRLTQHFAKVEATAHSGSPRPSHGYRYTRKRISTLIAVDDRWLLALPVSVRWLPVSVQYANRTDTTIVSYRDCAIFSAFGKEFPKFCSLVYSGGLSRDLDEIFVEIQDPSKWFHQENKSCDFLRVFLLGAFSPGFEERRSSFRDLTI
ncbi:hypothetical protein V6N12_010440 [Hibiscus sabdariffa]|uniref:Uncharacterized protein n=1 Tax=Hibiscus sabdariffa TaxID=183260 RepID=A0ABR2EKG0_9ROSI